MQKKLLILICFMMLGLTSTLFAQAPQQFNYQGALRNADGSVVASKTITIRLSVLNGSEQGAAQYSETRSVTTTALGMYSVAIGSPGANTSTNNFSAINWGGGLKYLKVEVDLAGGANFVSAGVAQLLSVPYALYAANAGADGKSAYQIWLDQGNTGTEADFINSLKVVNQSAGGDLSGALLTPKVVKIQGVEVSAVAPAVDQFLKFDGTSWKPASVPSVAGADVSTSQPDVIELGNNTDAALKNLTINLKAGTANSFLITDANQQVKWQSASDSKMVRGTMANVSFAALDDGTSAIPANNVAKLRVTVPGARAGDPVFLTNIGDETEYSILASWVSAPDEVSIRVANYQPIPVNISGRQCKILLIQNN